MWAKFIGFLQAGTSPEKLALACATGVVIGIVPVWGVTTFICFGLAAVLRINIALLQLVNYAMYPLQILLVLPYIKSGEYLFRLKPLPYGPMELLELFKTNMIAALGELGFAILTGVGVWAVTSIPLFVMVYFSSLAIFRKWKNNRNVPDGTEKISDKAYG